MGSSSSTQYHVQTQQERTMRAARNFHHRIKSYDYAYDGLYSDHVEWCHAQYQLECLPEECLQGPNYRPQYDGHGNQVY